MNDEIRQIEEKYASGSSSFIDFGDREKLIKLGYVLNENSPEVFKKNESLIGAMVRENPLSVDVTDPTIAKTISDINPFSIRNKIEIMKNLHKAGVSLSTISDGDLFEKSPQEDAFSIQQVEQFLEGRPKEINIGNSLLSTYNSIENKYVRNDLTEEERKIIIDTIFDLDIPATMVPNGILKDPLYVKKYCEVYQLTEDDERMINGTINTKNYDAELENDLVSSLGYNSLDEFVAFEIISNPCMQNRDQKYFNRDYKNDLVSLLAIKMRALKKLNEAGIYDVDYKINTVYQSNDVRNRNVVRNAVWNDKDKSLSCYLNVHAPSLNLNTTLKSLSFYTIHEVAHARQIQNMKTKNFDEDPDIDLYAMDQMIRFINSRETNSESYYMQNNKFYSLEFDAEYSAEIDLYNLQCLSKGKNPNDTLIDELEKEVTIRAEKEKSVLLAIETEMEKKMQQGNSYGRNQNRILPGYDTKDLEQTFIDYISKKMSDPVLKEEIIKHLNGDLAVLNYKFKFTQYGVSKLSIAELNVLKNQAEIEGKTEEADLYSWAIETYDKKYIDLDNYKSDVMIGR